MNEIIEKLETVRELLKKIDGKTSADYFLKGKILSQLENVLINLDKMNKQEKDVFFNLKLLMIQTKTPQNKIAELLGISRSQLSRFINGQQKPSKELVKKIDEFIKKQRSEFINGVTSKPTVN